MNVNLTTLLLELYCTVILRINVFHCFNANNDLELLRLKKKDFWCIIRLTFDDFFYASWELLSLRCSIYFLQIFIQNYIFFASMDKF